MIASNQGRWSPLHLLLIDVHGALADFEARLEQAAPGPCTTHICHGFAEARSHLSEQRFDAVISDLPGRSADNAAALRELVSACTHTPVIVLYSGTDADTEERMLRYGAQDYLLAAATSGNELLRSIRHAIGRKQLENELRATLGDLAQANARLQRMSARDALTGAMNRRAFLTVAEQAILRSVRRQRYVALFYFDLDDFKQINDRYGHAAGDSLLATCCQRVRPFLRRSDHLARLGGDEFVALIEDVQSPRDAWSAAQRIKDSLRSPVNLDGHRLETGASIGVALSSPEVSVDVLIRQADAAMYSAKHSGTGVRFFDAELDRRQKARERLRDDLQESGIDELSLRYQPISDSSGAVSRVHAQLHWQHPRFGLLHADHFMALAASSEMVRTINDRLFDWADAAWRNRLHACGMESVTVSLTSSDLHDPELSERMAARLTDHAIPRRQLCLAFPEEALARSPDAGRRTLHRLRSLGVTIALERFGRGHLPVPHLHRLPIDLLHLDAELVSGVDSDADLARLCRGCIQLGRALGLRVLARGITSQAEAETLWNAGCTLFQGDYIGTPQPLEKAATLNRSTDPIEPPRTLPWVEPDVGRWAHRNRPRRPLWKRRRRRQCRLG